MVLLGVNIDHVATVRNARGGREPDPLEAALLAERFGADGITVHLREDRRHIKDMDLKSLKNAIQTHLNLEMAMTDEMVTIATEIKPYMTTIVPEKRQELTTEGGLDVVRLSEKLRPGIEKLNATGIEVSLFIDPDKAQIKAAKMLGAGTIELHTGDYAHAFLEGGLAQAKAQLEILMDAAAYCQEIGLTLNAGHGLTYENVLPILQLPQLVELNIGHNIIAKSIFVGLGPAVSEMKQLLSQ